MAQKRLVGEPAPDFTLNDLDGRPHRLSDYRGRIVLLAFWSAECTWVERADALLQSMLSAWGADVVYLPVASNANESPAQIRQAAAARGLPLVLWDDHSQVAAVYDAQITPEFFIVDREGVLRYQGAFDDINFRQRTPTRNYVQEVVAALLAGRLPDTDFAAPYGCTVVRFSNLIA